MTTISCMTQGKAANPARLPVLALPRRRFRETWSVWLVAAAVALVAACVFAASDAWTDLAGMGWNDEESSHVLLVPFVVLWLVWVRRGRLRQCDTGGKAVGTACLAAGWLLHSIGFRKQIQTFWHAGAVLMAVGGLLTVLGKDVLLQFFPAFCVLIFLVPVEGTARQFISLPMQRTTAAVTQHVAEVLGLVVERSGNLLSVNGVPVAVVEACNGMRMVFTLFLASYVFAFVSPLRTSVRVLILGASPLTAILFNVLRLVPTVWFFGHYSNRVAEQFHDLSGWGMLVLAFLGQVGIVRLLRWASVPVSRFTLAEH